MNKSVVKTLRLSGFKRNIYMITIRYKHGMTFALHFCEKAQRPG